MESQEQLCCTHFNSIHQNCALLGYYAASSGEFLTDVSGKPIGPVLKVQDYGTDKLSRNFAKKFTTGRCVRTQKNAVVRYFSAKV